MNFKVPTISLQTLLENGVHFGHKRARWNPKMAPYIYKEHHGVHIIDLPQTILMLNKAMAALHQCVKNGGRILFVGTKLQARKAINIMLTIVGWAEH
jgi:small subunit ribosomal protein S2